MAVAGPRGPHGAAGIGLARIAMSRRNGANDGVLMTDVRNALAGAERAWPSSVDTLCCGTLGNIEFFSEAGKTLGRGDLRDLAARRLLESVREHHAGFPALARFRVVMTPPRYAWRGARSDRGRASRGVGR